MEGEGRESHNCELVSIIISIISKHTHTQKNLNYQARHGPKIRELTGLKMIKIQSQSSIFLWYYCCVCVCVWVLVDGLNKLWNERDYL